MKSLEELRLRYLAEREGFERLARAAGSQLGREVRRAGIPCKIEHRAKEVVSHIKKAIRKGYRDPWSEIHDKAGVRVIVLLSSAVDAVAEVADRCFRVLRREDKRVFGDPRTFEYQGVHLDAQVDDVDERVFEIQIHTHAQNLWAAVSHAMAYKEDRPPSLSRAIARLLAVLEIVDEEIARADGVLKTLPDVQERALLSLLESEFVMFRPYEFDEELSLHVLRTLGQLVRATDYRPRLRSFVEENNDRLRRIYDEYAEDSRHVLLSQPESLLVFERLSAGKHLLADRWRDSLPGELLEGLALAWGTPVELDDEG